MPQVLYELNNVVAPMVCDPLSLQPLILTSTVYSTMTSSPPFDSDEKSFLDQNNETSEHIRACLPCMNVNHLLQTTSGSGPPSTGKSGKKWTTGTRHSTSAGAKAPTVPNFPTSSHTSCLSGRRARNPSLFRRIGRQGERSSSPAHTTTCSIVYCASASRIWEGA